MQQTDRFIYFSFILFLLSGCNSSSISTSHSDQAIFSLPNSSSNSALQRTSPLAATTDSAKSQITEDNVTNFFQLSLSAAIGSNATVSYQTQDGTAVAGIDYTSTSGTATIEAGQTSVLIGVPILEDTAAESSETFSLVISNPTGGVFADGVTELSATHTILDDDASSANPIDITDSILSNSSANCADYINSYQSSVADIQRSVSFQGSLTIALSGEKCSFSTNQIPNHDFNDSSAAFASDVSEQASETYTVTTNPTASNTTTALSLSYDNALFLNGVKLDLLSAACSGIGNEKDGCFDIDQPFRFDPMSPLNNFGVDNHNAHPQPPGGAYHYHGSPVALFYTDTAVVSPVIGFAADGFPIYGSYFDDNGTIRKATSSYQIKQGSRLAVSGVNPGGSYDGQFIDDYEYSQGSGDLDACNGMTQNGSYGYYVTDTYPWVMGCFTGTPDDTFRKVP